MRCFAAIIAALAVALPQSVLAGTSSGTNLACALCTVHFDPCGGSSAETNRSVMVYHELGTLPRPKWPGYMFCGWWTEIEGGEQVVETTVVYADVTFYAHWSMNYGMLYFEDNYPDGPQPGVHSGIAYHGYCEVPNDDIMKPASPSGYVFNGWWTEPVGGERILPGTSIEGDFYFYAHWVLAEDRNFEGDIPDMEVVPGIRITVSPVDGGTLDVEMLAGKITIVPIDQAQDARFFKVVHEQTAEGAIVFQGVIDSNAIRLEDAAHELIDKESLDCFSQAEEGDWVEIHLANVQNGFYYGIAASGNVEGLSAASRDLEFKRADETGVSLRIPKPVGDSAFFRVLVKDKN